MVTNTQTTEKLKQDKCNECQANCGVHPDAEIQHIKRKYLQDYSMTIKKWLKINSL
jgi:hypothetical protein